MSVNQVGQLFVAKENKANAAALTAVGDIASVKRANGDAYIVYKDTDSIVRSDIITKGNLMYATSTSAKDMVRGLVRKLVTLSANVNGGAPVVGQNYVLNLKVRQFASLSDEVTYTQYGVVRGATGMTASTFYKSMALSIIANIKRDVNQFFNIYLQTSSSSIPVTATTKASSLTGTYTGVVIEEKEQEWKLGKIEDVPVYFDITSNFITLNGNEVVWSSVVNTVMPNMVKNGKRVAEMEYFALGARGDVYRGMGYPNNFDPTYLVDPTKQYHIVTLHYKYVGANHAAQASEKDLILVMPGSTNAETAKANNIITALKAATGVNIAAVAD